jgi:hypothetical protein
MRLAKLIAGSVGAAFSLALAAPSVASDTTVRPAVVAHAKVMDLRVAQVTDCADAGGGACLVRTGRGLRLSAQTANRAAGRAVTGNESTCVQRALTRYRTSLARYAALGLALQRGNLAQARSVSTTLSRAAVLSCAPTPAAGSGSAGAPSQPAPAGWDMVVECSRRWNGSLGGLALPPPSSP